MWNEAVEILAAGIINMNALTSFTSGFDRTVVVSDGQVIEVQLWSNEELRQNGAVRPSWVDWLENENGNERVRSVHRGWLHSIVVTESICGKHETRCRELEEKVRELEMKQAQASSSADFCQVEICSIPSQRFGYSFFLSLRK